MAGMFGDRSGDVPGEVARLRELRLPLDYFFYVSPSGDDLQDFLGLTDDLFIGDLSLGLASADLPGHDPLCLIATPGRRDPLAARERPLNPGKGQGWGALFRQPLFRRTSAPSSSISGGEGAALAGAIQAQANLLVSGSQLSDLSSSFNLVGFGAVWAFKDDGSNQNTAWRSVDFDASSWTSGPAQLGYGDGDEATRVNSGPSGAYTITTYFRHSFDLADPGALQQLDLSVIRDDGVVVYLNGVEVLRNNITANPSYTTLATTAIGGADESIPVRTTLQLDALPAGLLRSGANVLAVELHQSGATSSDLSFDAELIGRGRQFVLDVDLEAPFDPASLQVADLLIDGTAGAVAAAALDADTIRFTLPRLSAGSHSLRLAAGSLLASDGSALGEWTRSITIAAAPQYTVWQTPRLQLGDAPLTGYAGSGSDQVELLWQTRPAGGGSDDRFTVDVRLAGTAAWSPGGTIQQLAQPVDGRIVFSSRLQGLDYASGYEYRVQHWSGDVLLAEYAAPFRTRLAASDPTAFSFVAYGDSADPATIAQFRSVQARINSLDAVSPLAFALLLGDNTYSTGTHAQLDYRFVPSLAPEATAWASRRIDYAAFGNHDVMTDSGGPTEASFSSPIPRAGITSVASAPSAERPEHNYSFDYGDVHIATFDSNSLNDAARLNAQLTWLEQDLAASSATWKIVVAHHPVAGSPDKPETPSGNYYQQVVSRLRAAGVDLLLSGHTHTYHQSYPLLGQSGGVATYVLDTDGVYDKGAGLVQVAIGTGGTALRSGSFSDKPYIRAGFSTSTNPVVEPGFARLDVTPQQLVLSYVAADDGAVLSSFTILNNPDSSLRTSRFQQGSNGYAGSVDTMVRQASPDLSYGSASSLNVDSDDPSGSGNDVQSLLRFDDLFGSGAGQIPLDATIVAATVRLSVSNPGNALSLHRLLQSWDGTATWTGLVDGVSTNGIEALAVADASTGAVASGTLAVDVLTSLQAWQAGAPNRGWLLQPSGADGVDFASAEAASGRPQLEVQWRAATNTNLPPQAVSLRNPISSLAENTPLPADLKLADIEISDDGRGSNSLSLLGSDAGLFRLSGQTLFLRAGTSLDFEQQSSLSVTIEARDPSLPGTTPVTTLFSLVLTNQQEGSGSAAAITVANNAAPAEGVILQAGSVSGDPDGLTGTVTVDWLRNGIATGQSGSSVTVGATQSGSWQSRHTYTDGAGQLTSVLSPLLAVAAVDNGAGVLAPISADGALRVGVTLQAGAIGPDPDGTAANPQLAYQWLRNGVAIEAATAASYTTSAADLNASLAVRVSYTDGQEFRGSLSSAAVGPIVEATPPQVSGITVEGSVVTVSFNEAIQSSAPLLANLQVLVAGVNRLSSLSLDASNRQLRLNLSTTPSSGQTVQVIYTDPLGDQGTQVVQDTVGNDLAGFSRPADTLHSASAVSTLASSYTTLVLTGSSSVNGVGNANANLLQGNSGANRLDGLAGDDSLRGGLGLDSLTGGAGNDLFDYTNAGDALIGGTSSKPLFERIVDLQIGQASGSDTINGIVTSPTSVRQLTGQPRSLTRSEISTLLNGSSGGVANFAAAGVSSFTFGSGTGLRTFLAINDGAAGYDPNRDQLIEITGYTGTLSALSVV